MTEADQITRFGNELDKLVLHFRNEYEITYAGVVGALHMKAHLLCREAAEAADDEGNDEVDDHY